MNIKIVIFNLIYYGVIFFLFMLGRKDQSASLGYAIAIIIFWLIAAIALGFLLAKKIIWPTSFLDKVGIITATPLLLIIVIAVIWSGVFS